MDKLKKKPFFQPPVLICPRCGAEAELRDNADIYNGVSHGLAYICGNFPGCDTYVGANRRTLLPLGTMADRRTRMLRRQCHERFDPRWRSGDMSRKAAYAWMGSVLGLEDPHIGQFDAAQCRRLLAILAAQIKDP